MSKENLVNGDASLSSEPDDESGVTRLELVSLRILHQGLQVGVACIFTLCVV